MIGETGETSNGARELLQQMILHLRAEFFASMGLRARFIDHFD